MKAKKDSDFLSKELNKNKNYLSVLIVYFTFSLISPVLGQDYSLFGINDSVYGKTIENNFKLTKFYDSLFVDSLETTLVLDSIDTLIIGRISNDFEPINWKRKIDTVPTVLGLNSPTSSFSSGSNNGVLVVEPSPSSMSLINLVKSGVNLYNGNISKTLPIINLKASQISMPVELNYSSSGIKLDEIGSWVGQGWNLTPGGRITRIMKNLPDEDLSIMNTGIAGPNGEELTFQLYGYLRIKDDVDIDSSGVDLSRIFEPGFYSHTKKQKIAKYSNWTNQSPYCYEFGGECPIGIDTEPDEFYFYFGKYSGKFVFDQDGNILQIPDQNLKIEKTISLVDGRPKLVKFVVTTPEGIKYYFGDDNFESVEQSKLETISLSNNYKLEYTGLCKYNNGIHEEPNPNIVSFLNPIYLYKPRPVLNLIDFYGTGFPVYDVYSRANNSSVNTYNDFTSTWHLNRIVSPSESFINFTYEDNPDVEYVQSRNYSSSIPNLAQGWYNDGQNNFVLSESPMVPVYDVPYLYRHPKLANLTYSVSSIKLKEKVLKEIETSQNEKLIFHFQPRIDLLNGKYLEYIDLFTNNLFIKKWIFYYQNVNPVKYYNSVDFGSCLSPWNNPTNGQATLTGTIDIFNKEDFIDLKTSFISNTFSCEHMTSFRTPTLQKWLITNPNGSSNEFNSYFNRNLNIWMAEYNRFYLKKITETYFSLNDTLYSFDYNIDTDTINKRFYYKQDSWGYQNNNNRGTLLPKLNYTYNVSGSTYNSLYSILIGWDNVWATDWSFKGHNGHANTNIGKKGLINSIKFKTGGNIKFEYELNDWTNSVKGAGFRMKKIIENPLIGNNFTSTFSYLLPKYASTQIRKQQDIVLTYSSVYNHKEYNVLSSCHPMNPTLSTKSNKVGYGKVIKNYENNGRKEFYFINPSDITNGNPIMKIIYSNLDQTINGYHYPHTKLIDYDFRRGLIEKIITFKQDGFKIKEEINNWSFSTGFTPLSSFGINTGVHNYTSFFSATSSPLNISKYYIGQYFNLSDRINLNSKQITNYFDDNTSLTKKIDYTYNTDNFTSSELVQSIPQSTSKLTKYKYAKDYNIGFMLNAYMIGIPLEVTVNNGLGGGSKVMFTQVGNLILPKKYFSASYDSGLTWKLQNELFYDNNDSYPDRIKNRNQIHTEHYNWGTGTKIGLIVSKSYVNRSWNYNYNDKRKLTNIIDNLGVQSTFEYDDFQRLKTLITNNGKIKKTFSYQYIGGGASSNKITSVLSYPFMNSISPLTTINSYDGFGRITTNSKIAYTQAGNNFTTRNQYDLMGRVHFKTDPSIGGSTEYIYENSPIEKVTMITPPNSSHSISKSYGTNTAPISFFTSGTLFKNKSIDENGIVSEDYTDIFGRTIQSIRDVGGLNFKTTFEYNDRDQLTKIITPNPNITYDYTYYPDGLLHTKYIPDQGTYTYRYTSQDQIHNTTLPTGYVVENTYNSTYNDFLTGVYVNGSNTISNAGDVIKNQIKNQTLKILKHNGAYTTIQKSFSFDDIGNIISDTIQYPNAIIGHVYTYDDAQNIIETDTRIKGSDNLTRVFSTNESYDFGIRHTGQQISFGGTTTQLSDKSYNDNDWLTKNKIGDHLFELNFGYNTRGWLTSINSPNNVNNIQVPHNVAKNEVFGMKLYYDIGNIEVDALPYYNGNISWIDWCNPGESKQQYGFTYDKNNRLLKAKYGQEQEDCEGGEIEDAYSMEVTSYDNLGNIKGLTRNGIVKDGECYVPTYIDSLRYEYFPNSTKIKQVYENYPCDHDILTLPSVISQDTAFYANKVLSSNTVVDCDVNVNINVKNSFEIPNSFSFQDNCTTPPLVTINQGICIKDSMRFKGFVGNPNNGNYQYSHGNMTYDPNKDLHTIYNYLNLPEKVWKGNNPNNDYILWFYDALGTKFRKEVYIDSNLSYSKDYIGNVEYKDNQLEAIYHSEGRIIPRLYDALFEYYVKDHLGNIRVRLADKNRDGVVRYDTSGIKNEILETIDYYPFGMQLNQFWKIKVQKNNAYGYNNKELNSDLGYNLLNYGARDYDAILGRFTAVDPLADKYPAWNPYHYVLNNPVRLVDPTGMSVETIYEEEGTDNKVEVKDGIDKTIKVNKSDFAKAKEFASRSKVGKWGPKDGWSQSDQQEYNEFYNSVNSYDELSFSNVYDYFFGGPDDGVMEIPVGPPLGKIGGSMMSGIGTSPSISSIKKALLKVYKKLGIKGSLPKMKKGSGPKSTPRAGTKKKGYRLDGPHKDHKKYWHIDYWEGKRKAGGHGHIKID